MNSPRGESARRKSTFGNLLGSRVTRSPFQLAIFSARAMSGDCSGGSGNRRDSSRDLLPEHPTSVTASSVDKTTFIAHLLQLCSLPRARLARDDGGGGPRLHRS